MNKDDVVRHLTRHVLDKKQAKISVDKVFEIIGAPSSEHINQ